MAGINNTHVETVLVENSDDRLAEVEKAKATGQPLQSVASKGSVVTPLPVAQQIFDDASQLDTYIGPNGLASAAHLADWHEKAKDNAFVAKTNEEKAQAHNDYSADFVKAQQEENEAMRKKIAEGFDPAIAIQQANLERAREHEVKSTEYQALVDERAANAKDVWTVVDESVKALDAKDLNNATTEEKAKALKKVIDVPDVSEKAARDALITKDDIITGKKSFEDHAMDFASLQDKDHPAVAIIEAAGSPEALREDTAVAQAAAGNMTEEAVKTDDKVEDVKPSDEMLPNPSE